MVSGDNTAVTLDFQSPFVGAVAGPMTHGALGPSDFDGQTEAVSVFGAIDAYAIAAFSDPLTGGPSRFCKRSGAHSAAARIDA